MHAQAILAVAGSLLALVSAAPMNQIKRDIVYETHTEEFVTTVGVTTTVWVDATGAPDAYVPTVTIDVPPTSSPASVEAVSSAISTSQAPAVVEPVPSSFSSYQAAPSSDSAPAPSPPSTSDFIPPVTSTSSSVYVDQPTSSVAPITTSAAPVYTTPAAPAPSSSNSGSSPSGSTYTGDITYYDAGLGSCGSTNTNEDAVVAVAAGMMQKSFCGKSITISYQGSTHSAVIADTCPGCSGGSLDLTPSLFKAVAPNGDGRVHDVEWWFSS